MVIHYDPWWNVAAQNQATDRAHRIGQENQVSVFKLITKHTDRGEHPEASQEMKRDLADTVVTEGTGALSSITRGRPDPDAGRGCMRRAFLHQDPAAACGQAVR